MLENSLYGREFLLDCEFPEGVDEAALTKDLSEEETERSLLESQWELPSKDPELSENVSEPLQASSSRKASRNIVVNKSMSARKRRMQARRNRDLQDQTADANVFRVGLESKGKGDVSEKESSSDFLATFLTEIGKAKLLTREEEIELSRRVKKSVELQNLRARVSEELGREATHSEWAKAQGCSVYSLRRKLREGELARHKLLATNLRLVVSVAKKYIRCGVELSDLVAAGTMGLSKGVEKFDPNRGYKLSTYLPALADFILSHSVFQAVTRAVADHSRTIRLPVHVHETLGRLRRAKAQLASEGELASVKVSDVPPTYILFRSPSTSLSDLTVPNPPQPLLPPLFPPSSPPLLPAPSRRPSVDARRGGSATLFLPLSGFRVLADAVGYDYPQFNRILKYHLIPDARYTLADLKALREDSLLPTAEGSKLKVFSSRGSKIVWLQGRSIIPAAVTIPNLFVGERIIVHGLSQRLIPPSF
ncbi:unnamed protein product [Closterium sp. NIES-53]